MSSKNYTLSGVSSSIELGKGGNQISSSAGIVSITLNNGSTLARTRGADAINTDEYVTLNQLSNISSGLTWKNSVVRVSIRAIGGVNGAPIPATITNLQLDDAFDGSTSYSAAAQAGDRLLVNAQDGVSPSQYNGIYILGGVSDAWTLTRASDAGTTDQATGTATISTDDTGAYPDVIFVCTTDDVEFGDPIIYSQYGTLGPGVASLTSSGDGVSLVSASTGAINISDLIAGQDVTLSGGSGSTGITVGTQNLVGAVNNTGTGAPVAKISGGGATNDDAVLRGLSQGNAITIVQNTDDIVISVTAGEFVESVTNSPAPLAAFPQPLVDVTDPVNPEVYQLNAGSGIQLENNVSDGYITVTAVIEGDKFTLPVNSIVEPAGVQDLIVSNNANESTVLKKIVSDDGSVVITTVDDASGDQAINFRVTAAAPVTVSEGQGTVVTQTGSDYKVETANPDFTGTGSPARRSGVPLVLAGVFSFTGNGSVNHGTLPEGARVLSIHVWINSSDFTAGDLSISAGSVEITSAEIDATTTGVGQTFLNTNWQRNLSDNTVVVALASSAGGTLVNGEYAITYVIGPVA